MTIREYRPSDVDKLREIHEKYYRNEFSLPDFLTNYLCSVVIEDSDGIITIGGVRNIAEAVAVTNKDASVRRRREALYQLHHALSFIANANNHKQLHAFIQDDVWGQHLLQVGFTPTKGKALVMEI